MTEHARIPDRPETDFPRDGLLHRLAGSNGLAALDGLLRANGFRIGADRWQSAHDLLLAMQGRGLGADDLRGLRPMLAPLFCRNQGEQQRFGNLFDLWCSGLEEPRTDAHRTGRTEYVEPLPRPRWRQFGWRLPAAIALILLLAAGISLWWYQTRLASIDEIPRDLPRQKPQIIGGGDTTEKPKLTLRPLPPRSPLETPELNSVNRWLVDGAGVAIAVIPMLLILPWLALTWIGYGQVLRRRRVRGARPLHRITLDAGQDDFFDAPPLREALRRLHRSVSAPTRWLDAEASARRTAHGARPAMAACSSWCSGVGAGCRSSSPWSSTPAAPISWPAPPSRHWTALSRAV